jgi:DNA-directed RNA polymerase specialized sigma24 family protein
VSDPATDSEPPSGAALAVALGRGDEAGLLAAYEAYGPELFGYAEFLLAGRPDPEVDRPGGAVVDALLVATGAVADLTDPDRLLAWLLALTRNECLRLGAVAASETEAAELGRCGLSPLEVAAVLGFAPAALPRRVPPPAPPEWLRAELVAAAGPAGAVRRGELTRRARPFEPDGFPVPLDRRRLSGKVLAWSAAAVVVVALGLLVGLPTKGNAGAAAVEPARLAEGAAPASATAAPVPAEAGGPIPTLGSAPFGSADSSRPADADPPTVADSGAPAPSTGVSTAAPAGPQAGTDATDPRSRPSGGIELTWSPVGCGDRWTAHLHATTGGVEVSRVVAVAPRADATVSLYRDGDGWSGDLAGLPTGRTVTVTVFAGGAVRPASARLRADC